MTAPLRRFHYTAEREGRTRGIGGSNKQLLDEVEHDVLSAEAEG